MCVLVAFFNKLSYLKVKDENRLKRDRIVYRHI